MFFLCSHDKVQMNAFTRSSDAKACLRAAVWLKRVEEVGWWEIPKTHECLKSVLYCFELSRGRCLLMGFKQLRSAGSGEGGATAASPWPRVYVDRSTSDPDCSWREPHSLPHTLRPGVLLRGQQRGTTRTQQGGWERYKTDSFYYFH